ARPSVDGGAALRTANRAPGPAAIPGPARSVLIRPDVRHPPRSPCGAAERPAQRPCPVSSAVPFALHGAAGEERGTERGGSRPGPVRDPKSVVEGKAADLAPR